MSTEPLGDRTWIECDYCGQEQPETLQFKTRNGKSEAGGAAVAARRHGWKLRLRRPEGYLDVCDYCYDREKKIRQVGEILRALDDE